jgi:hypothetical protein
MSTGAGRVEQAIRDYIGEHYGRRSQRIVYPDALFVAAFGRPPWTRAQRGSVLRAMHRIIAGQPGWRVYSPEGKRGVVFAFTPPQGTPESKRAPAAHLAPRPRSQRQIAQEKREKRLARERAKLPVVLSYFWTAGRDTVSNFVAGLLDLPKGRAVTTIPDTTPWYRSGIGCEAFDQVAPPPQTEEEALRALGLLDVTIRQAVSFEEVLWYQAKAGAIHYMFPVSRPVREKTEIVDLYGHWVMGRHLHALDRWRAGEPDWQRDLPPPMPRLRGVDPEQSGQRDVASASATGTANQ